MMAKSQLQDAKNSKKFDGIKQFFWDWHRVTNQLCFPIEWMVVPSHPFLCPIAKHAFI